LVDPGDHRLERLAIIALSAPLLTIAILTAQQRHGAWISLKAHIGHGLASTVNELALFLAAGVLAAGLTSLSHLLRDWLPFDQFGAPQAGLILIAMVGVAALGVHPVITIAAFGVWLAPLHPEPDLLAITLLMAWAIGVPANPLSGLHLMMQGRYGIDGYAFLYWNRGYVLLEPGVCAEMSGGRGSVVVCLWSDADRHGILTTPHLNPALSSRLALDMDLHADPFGHLLDM